MNTKNRLDRILTSWRSKQYLIATTIFVVGLIIAYLLRARLDLQSLVSLILIAATIVTVISLFFKFTPTKSDLLALLDEQIKGTEHSSHLLDKTDSSLSVLQRIQKSKVASVLDQSKVNLPFIKKPIFSGLGMVGICLLVLGAIPTSQESSTIKAITEASEALSEKPIEPAALDTIIIQNIVARITPPNYTNQKKYSTSNLSLNIPERSVIKWQFDISGQADQSEIIFDDKRRVSLNANNSYSQTFSNPSFYQYRFAKGDHQSIVSDYFPIKIIEDQDPKIEITDIAEYQRLEYKENHDINFNIQGVDDYGLNAMFISATLAKGSGESVKFREKQIELKDLKKGSDNYSGSYQFSTQELDMEPGDELYFYVAGKDNCPFENHWSKSTTHFVVLEDTTAVTLVEAGGMQLDIMPDFFRSQRQIIIDTEKLIAEKDTLSKKVFKERSNELGYDQKLLRLKYGQFLGEESESGLDFDNDVDMDLEGEEHDHADPNHVHDEGNKTLNDARSLIDQFMHDHDHEEEENQLLETKGTEKIEQAKNPEWVKEMSHNHDNTEEATFFDVSIKSKLRAALNEMWDAELHLRLFDPEKSLPYQYNSLAFLDEVKNHARAYVQRIGFEPPAIKEQETRLTGELKEVYSTRDILKAEVSSNTEKIKAALPILLDLQQSASTTSLLGNLDLNLLQRAGDELSQIAISKSAYLPVLSKLRSLISHSGQSSAADLSIIIEGFLAIIPKHKKEAIASRYFRHPINVKVINDFKKSR